MESPLGAAADEREMSTSVILVHRRWVADPNPENDGGRLGLGSIAPKRNGRRRMSSLACVQEPGIYFIPDRQD